MGCKCAPALLVARDELNACFPARDKASDGCCGDDAHKARKSDHNANLEGYARAYDYDEDISSVMGDQELQGMALVLLGDRRTKYLIYEARLLYPDGTVKPYSGINAHKHHLHHSIHDWAVHDRSPWGIAGAFQPAPPAPIEEVPFMALSDAEQQEILAAVRTLVWPPGTPPEDRHPLYKIALWTLGKAGTDQVDEQAIAAAVLAGLDAATIGAAIPEAIAAEVADVLAERLQG